jgi:hypothetical protein
VRIYVERGTVAVQAAALIEHIAEQAAPRRADPEATTFDDGYSLGWLSQPWVRDEHPERASSFPLLTGGV